MLSFFCFTYKETYKLYALLRFIVIDMPKNEVRIYNSKAVIYQNDYDVWQFRMWLADEDKYIRQSLRTKDKAKAVADAEALYEDIKYMKRRGKLRMEMQRVEHQEPLCGPKAWLVLRGGVSANVDQQGTQSQYRLVCGH